MPSGPVVVLTQEAEDNAALAALLAPAGIASLSYPCLATRYQPYSGGQLNSGCELAEYDVVVFTSKRAVAAVETARELLAAAKIPVACVGTTTAEAVRRLLGIGTALLPPGNEQTGAALAQAIVESDLPVQRALYFCGSQTTGGLQTGLTQAGIAVDEQQVYENYAPELAPLDQPEAALVVFASPSAAKRFFSVNPEWLGAVSCISIGPVTSACLKELGARETGQAVQPDKAGLAAAVINCLQQERFYE